MTRFLILLATLAMMLGFAGCDRLAPRQNPGYDQQRYGDRYDRRRHDDRYRDDRRDDDRFDRRRSDGWYTEELLHLHNEERSRNTVQRLRVDPVLERAARSHAEWMARNDRLTHRGDNGSDVQSRVGGNYRCVGENIAMGFYDPDEVMRKWMNSYGHKKNIVDRSYNKVGFGVAYARDGTMYWCVVFAG